MLKTFFTTFAAATLVLLAGTASAATDKEPLRIALIDPLSGSMASIGESVLASLQFDAERINKEGGADGHKIEVIGLDNKVNPQESLVQLRKAIDDGVHFIVQGAGSAVGSALLNAVNKQNQRSPDNRVVYLNWAAVDPSFTNQRCSFWHFRFDENSDMKMNILTSWIATQKNIHKIFLINQDYSFGHAVSDAARKMLKAKRPDIEIVGNAFVPLGKVKDFTPYVAKIKVSGADAVITGNWGQDMTLLIKAAADYGVDVPFLTYYGDSPGVISQIGKNGVDRVYLVSSFNGDFTDPERAKREVEMYKKTGWDYSYVRTTNMLEMLKKAVEKAGSIDPTKVAFALEGLEYDTYAGPAVMRAADHQIQMPMFVSALKGNVKYGLEGTDMNFQPLSKFTAEQGEMATSCHMRRPKQ